VWVGTTFSSVRDYVSPPIPQPFPAKGKGDPGVALVETKPARKALKPPTGVPVFRPAPPPEAVTERPSHPPPDALVACVLTDTISP